MTKNHSLRIKVFYQATSSKSCYERIVELPHAVTIPYNQLCDSLRFLYGSQCVIQFESSLYESMK